MALVIKNSRQFSPNLLQLKPIIVSEWHRTYGSLWQMIGAKYRLFVNGSERVIPQAKPAQPDSIMDIIHRETPYRYAYEQKNQQKRDFMKHKSHQRLIEHNKRIRKLHKKITAGVYSNWGYANKW